MAYRHVPTIHKIYAKRELKLPVFIKIISSILDETHNILTDHFNKMSIVLNSEQNLGNILKMFTMLKIDFKKLKP